MRTLKHILTLSFFCAALTPAFSQSYSTYTDATLYLKSDTNTKTVLLSNVLEDKVGDQSPFIGAAAWFDRNKNLECRSLLYFDYGLLDKLINPELIVSAELILKPYDPQKGILDMTEPVLPGFYVKRITEPWIDSLATWQAQPAVDNYASLAHAAWKKKKDPEVRVDVTTIVKEMFSKGNNGFMLTLKDTVAAGNDARHQWFASARNEDEKLRPKLFIKLSLPTTHLLTFAYPGNNYDLINNSIVWPKHIGNNQTLSTPLPPMTTQIAPVQNVVPVPVNDAPPPKSSGNSNNRQNNP